MHVAVISMQFAACNSAAFSLCLFLRDSRIAKSTCIILISIPKVWYSYLEFWYFCPKWLKSNRPIPAPRWDSRRQPQFFAKSVKISELLNIIFGRHHGVILKFNQKRVKSSGYGLVKWWHVIIWSEWVDWLTQLWNERKDTVACLPLACGIDYYVITNEPANEKGAWFEWLSDK